MRRDSDRGVIALLDPRLRRKSWGKAILASLPPRPSRAPCGKWRASSERAILRRIGRRRDPPDARIPVDGRKFFLRASAPAQNTAQTLL
ncbi:hypothetical protein GBA65_12010 [Rubrobacter marinus]|uniref:Uncharacterized protein n=1 Tax=Rubrobacter marinus TaxID=2653852 RepID=A0A6G8PY90_9ACTN|nr:hypothetical protein GBA65_12010 [Rubrobacter marinus]